MITFTADKALLKQFDKCRDSLTRCCVTCGADNVSVNEGTFLSYGGMSRFTSLAHIIAGVTLRKLRWARYEVG